jgi:hypothetical protein
LAVGLIVSVTLNTMSACHSKWMLNYRVTWYYAREHGEKTWLMTELPGPTAQKRKRANLKFARWEKDRKSRWRDKAVGPPRVWILSMTTQPIGVMEQQLGVTKPGVVRNFVVLESQKTTSSLQVFSVGPTSQWTRNGDLNILKPWRIR